MANHSHPSSFPSPSRIPELDGFRATAVLAVLIAHCFYGWPLPDESLSWLPRFARELISHGWLGVDLFFILSGFLITGVLLDSRLDTYYFRNFYARRALRILPLYWFCILVMSTVYVHNTSYFILSFIFLANFAHYFRTPEPHGPGVFWSLAVEEHFYIMWPLLIRFLSRNAVLVVSIIIVLGTPVLRGVCAAMGMDPDLEIYAYSFFRFDGLALGAVLAIWARSQYYSRTNAWKLAATLTVVSVVLTLSGLPFGIMHGRTVASAALRYTQAQLIFAAAMAVSLVYRGTYYTSILRAKGLKLIADLSYCIYLVHLCLGDFYIYLLNLNGIKETTAFGPVGALAMRCLIIPLFSLAVAIISKHILEDPCLRLKQYFEPTRPVTAGGPR